MEAETKSKLRNDVRDVVKGVAVEVIAAAVIALAGVTIIAIANSRSKPE